MRILLLALGITLAAPSLSGEDSWNEIDSTYVSTRTKVGCDVCSKKGSRSFSCSSYVPAKSLFDQTRPAPENNIGITECKPSQAVPCLCDMVVGDCGCFNVAGNLDNRWLVQGGGRSTPASYDQPEVSIRTEEAKVQRYKPRCLVHHR